VPGHGRIAKIVPSVERARARFCVEGVDERRRRTIVCQDGPPGPNHQVGSVRVEIVNG